jgi:hypothetical protein
MFNFLKQKNTKKIILTSQSEDRTADFIQQIATETFCEGFDVTNEKLSWSDLTTSSQRKMLRKTVIFQGKRVALNQLTSAQSMRDSFPLADLLQGKELTIGEKIVPFACKSYNGKYYIGRTFNHNIVKRQDILNEKEDVASDKRKRKFDDLLAFIEQEFKQLFEQNPKKSVHWLENKKSGELIWQQSQGNLKLLRTYTD